MTQEEVRAKHKERLDAENAAFGRGEEVEADRRLNDAREGLAEYASHAVGEQESVAEVQGYSASPTGEDRRPAYERTAYTPRVISLHETLELWAAHERGSLASVLTIRPGDDGKPRGDDAARAWEWVNATPGYSEKVRLVLRHLVMKGQEWATWPAAPPSPVGPLEIAGEGGFCPWPPRPYCIYPFLTRSMAVRLWGDFARALKRHHNQDPFTVEEQFFESR